ncbi:c-type cytochrome [Croceicoccus gelatinilyticus]|uniref:c-type cytochrome n=1 Tax=Croceicoccus gelatinilyticus TaxID=2835536 RepID=UPI001CEC5F89|nr:c-type cytochrome [Croceicoccus gelatinilyticus]
MSVKTNLIIMSLLALAGCSGGADEAPSPAEETATPSLFAEKVAPTFQAQCATCHLTGQEQGNVSLIPAKAIENLVGVPSEEAPDILRVKAGDPDASYLVMKIEGTHLDNGGSGSRMPFAGAPLTDQQIADIRQWIAEGAKP